MAKKRRKKKSSRGWRVIKFVSFILWKGVSSPIVWIARLVQKSDDVVSKRASQKPVKRVDASFNDFKVLQSVDGSYAAWKKLIFTSESKIGIILGARGTGKTAFGMSLLENIHAKTKRACFAMGFDEKELPSWVTGVEDTSGIKNNSFVLIDEGGILFSSRKSMSSANTILSKLLMIARHKNISILFISQNSSNLEVNILRQADFLVLKPSSLLQKDFERKIIKKIYDAASDGFSKFSSERGLTYIYSDAFRGFVSNGLPSFWKESISKSFANQ